MNFTVAWRAHLKGGVGWTWTSIESLIAISLKTQDIKRGRGNHKVGGKSERTGTPILKKGAY